MDFARKAVGFCIELVRHFIKTAFSGTDLTVFLIDIASLSLQILPFFTKYHSFFGARAVVFNESVCAIFVKSE